MLARSPLAASPTLCSLAAKALAAMVAVYLLATVASAQAPPPPPAAGEPPAPAADTTPAPASEAPDTGRTGPGGERAPAERPLLPPADPVAAAAYKVLETHCARCHQGGRLQRPAPAAQLGNILRLDEISGEPALVRPGNPDASRLYTHMLRRLMPYDVHQEGANGSEPTGEELTAVRNWIARLKPVPACQDRRFVTLDAEAQSLKQIAEQAGPAAGRLRFVSLAHLYNACATPEAMFGHRQAITRLFNSLSWKPGPVRVEPVDEARTLLRIDLEDLGWVAAHWERIVRSAANGPGHLALLPKSVTEPFGVEQPVVRGDWLAETVLKAPLYYDLLGLPGLTSEVARIMQIDPAVLRRASEAQREIVKSSSFARGSRFIERLAVRGRTLWTAYDQAPRDGRRDFPETALAPAAAPPAHDSTLSLFLLPNGLPAFFIANGRGDRVDQVPGDIVRGDVHARRSLRAGVDCMACHGLGPMARSEDGERKADIARAAARDRDLVKDSLAAVGVEAGFTIDGVEPIAALAREFRRPVSSLRAAADLGLEPGALAARHAGTTGGSEVMLRRLLQGLVGRGEFEGSYRDLLATLHGKPLVADPAGAVPSAVDAQDPGPALVLLSDKLSYKAGDTLRLTVRTRSDCHLTLISVDQRGRGTVIYPSDFEPNNLLPADRELQLPAPGAPYLFRLKEKGRESIVAICNAAGATIDGIRHDFERQRFTDLGSYAAFIAQVEATNGDRRQTQAAPAAPQPDTKGRGRRRAPAKPEAAEPKARPDQITHTSISIDIE